MKSRFQRLSQITSLDYYLDGKEGLKIRTSFSNVVFISLPVVYLIFMAIDYDAFLIPLDQIKFDGWIVPIMIAVCFFCFWLNKIGYTKISRILFLVLWPLLMHIIPIKLLNAPIDYALAYPFGIVFHSMLIQLMFSYKYEWKFFWPLILINLSGLFFFPNLLNYFDTSQVIPESLIYDRYFLLDGILYWLLFNLVTFYILFVIDIYLKRVNESRILIENQKEELSALNDNLERLVSQRTQELESQNKKLKDYAFYNAHVLRGPFCRVKGLIYLQEMSKESASDSLIINTKLSASVQELDDVINEIQKIVYVEIEDLNTNQT